jgi:hypothetical protein
VSGPGPIASGLLLALEHPRTWLLALAAFLIRGGIVAFLLPVVVLPTPTGLGNAIGADLASLVFGGPSDRLILIALAAIATLTVWLVGGGLAAAIAELELVRIALEADDRPCRVAPSAIAAGRIVLARAICQLPLALVVAVGTVRLVSVTYAELIRPGDMAIPVVFRVAAAVPDVLLGLTAALVIGQLLGALATRRLALGGSSILGAVGWSLRRIVRRPAGTLGAFLVPLVASVAALAPMLVGAAIAWRGVSQLLRAGADPAAVAAGMLLFIVVWTSGLLVAGLTAAWRSATMTLEVAPEPAAAPDLRGMRA